MIVDFPYRFVADRNKGTRAGTTRLLAAHCPIGGKPVRDLAGAPVSPACGRPQQTFHVAPRLDGQADLPLVSHYEHRFHRRYLAIHPSHSYRMIWKERESHFMGWITTSVEVLSRPDSVDPTVGHRIRSTVQ